MSFPIPTMISDVLNFLLFFVFLFVALRAFPLYVQLRSPRMFILGLSMAFSALTALSDFTTGLITTIYLNVHWFLAIGQGAAFLFLLLSLLYTSTISLRRLMVVQVIAFGLISFLLFLAPILPGYPNPMTALLLGSIRCLCCFLIFCYYATSLLKKETRFALLISMAFLLLSIGYLLILPKYLLAGQDTLDSLGDFVRIIGIIFMIVAYAQKR